MWSWVRALPTVSVSSSLTLNAPRVIAPCVQDFGGYVCGSLASPAELHDENAQAQSPYTRGDVIAGKYELEQLLGQGGMGAVWRAQNVALDAAAAIKIMNAAGDR